jgi:predicted Zn-dependent protease
LDNQWLDTVADEVVAPKDNRPQARKILSACFDKQAYKTVLQLAGETTLLEIEL